MSRNLNSLAKDNFQRVSLIEAHISLFNYGLFSICETSLNDSVELPEPLLNEYTFVPANNPTNTRHGGVGLFYKNSLPVVVRKYLRFDESIVIELKFGRKKYVLLFSIETFDHNSSYFQAFLSNFRNLYVEAEKHLSLFFIGDFNAHSQFWWPDGDATPEGTEIEHLLISLGLSHLDSGTPDSLDLYCHHQIIYCKVYFRIPPPPPLDRKIWHFNKAYSAAIRRSMTSFPWRQHLNLNTDTNWQVKIFTDIFKVCS